VYAFELMSCIIGRKASRYSDGSVFSFCAIYTGATFANFIFITVKFNSPTFWALLVVGMMNIITVQGGIMIDIDYLFMDFVASSERGSFLYELKLFYFEYFRELQPKLARQVADGGLHPSPEIQLLLIRSRAKVLQLDWVHNDIKMTSEFQALTCAGAAVAMEIVYSHYGIGSDSITAHVADRRGLLYIFLVNILFSFVAQTIARSRLRSKVTNYFLCAALISSNGAFIILNVTQFCVLLCRWVV
jgi:hypothetical protein